MPRRTLSSTRTTTIGRPSKRVTPGEGRPTLALTPVEIEAIVQSAAVGSATSDDPDSHQTVESFRIAMGTSSNLEPPVPPGPGTASPTTAPPAEILAEAASAAGTRPRSAIGERGPRRTRESLRVDAIKPLPARKR